MKEHLPMINKAEAPEGAEFNVSDWKERENRQGYRRGVSAKLSWMMRPEEETIPFVQETGLGDRTLFEIVGAVIPKGSIVSKTDRFQLLPKTVSYTHLTLPTICSV